MSDAQRWELMPGQTGDAWMERMGSGAYVMHYDYAALEERLKTTEQQRDHWRKQANDLQEKLGQCMRDPEWVGTLCAQAVTDRDELRAKVARLEASIVEEKARVTEVEEWYADQVWELVTAQSDRDELRAALRDEVRAMYGECAEDISHTLEPSTKALLLRLGDLVETDAGLRWKT